MDSRVFDIVLASASPRRRELLQQIGVRCQVMPVDIDESPLADEMPTDYVSRLASEKAEAASNLIGNDHPPVLGADTIVELQGELLGKPADSAQAVEMLTRLSGATHQVHTAVAVVCHGATHQRLQSSRVTFAELTEAQIRAYVDTGEPLDKAGAYGIQGAAAAFIRHLEGSFSSVMGLPLFETAELLAQCGVEPVYNNYNSELA